jgi:hypothetical protein
MGHVEEALYGMDKKIIEHSDMYLQEMKHQDDTEIRLLHSAFL